MNRLRLAVVVTHPIQYHACLWRALAGEEDIDLRVFYCLDPTLRGVDDQEFDLRVKWDLPLLDGYRSRFFRNLNPSGRWRGFFRYINPGLIAEICLGKYDYIYCHGYRHLTHLSVMIGARLTGKKVIFRGIGYNQGRDQYSLLRRYLLSILYKLPSVCLYIGRMNREYYRSFGVPELRLVHSPHVVDNFYFSRRAEELISEKDRIRARFGIQPGEKVILFCGKFIKKKQPLMLLEAFLKASIGREWVLMMVGEGALKDKLQERGASDPKKKVIFTGFLNQSKISDAYAISEILILPSTAGETWGLTVNEAMNFSCGVIVSDMVGCGPELVEGEAGEIFRYDDMDDLIGKIKRLTSDEKLLRYYQENAKKTISKWGVSEFVIGVRRALSLDIDETEKSECRTSSV